MRHLGFVLGCGAVVLLGCVDRRGDDAATLDGADSIVTVTASASASASETSDTAVTVSASGSDSNLGKLDLPDDGESNTFNPTDAERGCAKVDFVFVVDSSLSMEDEQVALLASLPGFITAIEETLMFNDFHLMAIDAGVTEGAGCDGELGVGQVVSGDGQDCGVTGGQRYVTSTQEDLSAVFTCSASRGIEGALNEQTLESLLAAIGTHSEAGGCNEGFLRDDAILVVTIITDEEDSPDDLPTGGFPGGGGGECSPIDSDTNSTGTPQSWYDRIVELKGGKPESAVVLGLLGDCDLADGQCPGFSNGPGGFTGAEAAPRIREFVNLFPLGSVGPICADDFAPFFTDAVSVIEQACEVFDPIE